MVWFEKFMSLQKTTFLIRFIFLFNIYIIIGVSVLCYHSHFGKKVSTTWRCPLDFSFYVFLNENTLCQGNFVVHVNRLRTAFEVINAERDGSYLNPIMHYPLLPALVHCPPSHSLEMLLSCSYSNRDMKVPPPALLAVVHFCTPLV